MLVVLVLLVTVAMRVAIVTAVVYLLLPRGPLCPHCGIEMVPLRNRFLDRLLPALQRRWCLECGWDGVVRRGRATGARRSGLGTRDRLRAPGPQSRAPSSAMSRAARSEKKQSPAHVPSTHDQVRNPKE